MTDFAPDTFTENDVLIELERAGKKYRNGSRYILAQCPTHDDEHESVQIYKDDWFVNCHAGCSRYHITKAFPALRGQSQSTAAYRPPVQKAKQMTEHIYKQFDLMEEWESMELIPEDHEFKGMPIEVLNDLGWRYDRLNERYFIPYFSRSRETIPFAQYRNLVSGPRFNFLKDAKPTCYGTWNLLPGAKLFVVEGTSDCAVLDYCAVPWIGLPSAASGELMKSMTTFCKNNDIELVYAGDNDEAGDKLREALDMVMSYRVKQPPKQYKDWGDYLMAEGYDAVVEYTHRELFPKPADMSDPNIPVGIRELWPDAEIVETPPESKEQSAVLPMEF